MEMEVRGRTALITGANRGLGLALVEAFKAAGASKVYAAARRPDSVRAEGVVPVALDVTDADAASRVAKQCSDTQILINNAGIVIGAPTFSDGFASGARAMLETNFFGTWNVSKAFAPVLASNGGGAIVNILSVLTWLSMEGRVGYSAAKVAAWALTNGMRKELRNQGILVSALHVGYIDTDMTTHLDNVNKASPHDVARKVIEGIRDERPEILADERSVQIKAALGSAQPPYV
jgi:NAD(P)-dependent dehydrogenase (short-subunit alcohol dehydrogenase family)